MATFLGDTDFTGTTWADGEDFDVDSAVAAVTGTTNSSGLLHGHDDGDANSVDNIMNMFFPGEGDFSASVDANNNSFSNPTDVPTNLDIFVGGNTVGSNDHASMNGSRCALISNSCDQPLPANCASHILYFSSKQLDQQQ